MSVLSIPFEVWVGLVAVGTANEITAANYQRQRTWMDYTADGVTLANTRTVEWDIAREDWGDISLVELWEGPAGSSKIASMQTLEITPVPLYARVRIRAGDIPVVRIAGPRPYGRRTFGTGRYGTGNLFVPVGSGIPTPYGVGPYGVGPYGTLPRGVPLEVTFDYSVHECAPGTWAPGPFRWAA